ncbi:MAG: hypothetical protein H7A32_01470 [Deltaproteobacteria bacterium]|nr:hypothetical protein [Deltaproteobacteria bacterium]
MKDYKYEERKYKYGSISKLPEGPRCFDKRVSIGSQTTKIRKKTDFAIGYMAAFHRIVSLMQQQAEAFSISIDEIGLEGIDADEDLV